NPQRIGRLTRTDRAPKAKELERGKISLARELESLWSCDPHFQAEQIPGEWILLQRVSIEIRTRRGNIEFIQSRSTKDTTGRTQSRHRYNAIHFPIGSIAYDLSTIPEG